MILSRI